MTNRLDTTAATAEGAVFSPAGDFFLQVKADAGDMVLFDVYVRVEAGADWIVADTIMAREKVVRYAAFPFVKVAVRDNVPGKSAKAWTNL